MSSTLINFRIDEELKIESQAVLKQLGVSTSDLLKYTLQYVVENKKLPVSLKIIDAESKQIEVSKIRFNEINEKILSGKHTFIYSRIGAGASALVGDAIIQMIKNGNGLIISNDVLSNRLFLDEMVETANLFNREIKVLELKDQSNVSDEFEYGLNPLLNNGVEALIHFLFGNSISQPQKTFIKNFIETLKSFSNFRNLLQLEELIKKSNIESYGFNEDELKSINILVDKIQSINSSTFSHIFNNLNEERNIDFHKILEKNEILLIDKDYFQRGDSYELAKDLISNLLDFSISISEKSKNTNYIICSDNSVFKSKSILRNIAIGLKFNLNFIYQSMSFKSMGEQFEAEYIINSNCHIKIICGHPDLSRDYENIKRYFGSEVANAITNDFTDGIALIDQNANLHCYSK
jgi:addiction module RelB/DinJ family antitoxin